MSDTRYRRIFGVPQIPEDRPSMYTLEHDPEEIREALALFSPELENARMEVDPETGDIRFETPAAGSKGWT